MQTNIVNVTAAIEYIESHLADKLDLGIVAQAVHYSKYHLHRIFTETVGLTIHDYVQRRKLTEAAKLLIFSDKPIIEIALISGYESQQAFTTIFRQMYKKTPGQYRDAEEFYPLQLRYVLNNEPTKICAELDWQRDIHFALDSDIPTWMDLVHLVVDGYPYLKEEEYLEHLKRYIQKKQALVIKDKAVIIGAMAFDNETGSIDFLGVHPQYRKQDIAKAFLRKIWGEWLKDTPVSITTFREGDKADPGYREVFKKLGFAEEKLLIEFGYPTQKLTLQKRIGRQAVMSEIVSETPENPLSQNFTIYSLLQFAFPTIFMMIFMSLYTIGDTIIISRFVNTDALSALNIVTPVINIIVQACCRFYFRI